MTHRYRDPASGIWIGCAAGTFIWLIIFLALIWTLGNPSEAEGQSFFEPAMLEDAKTWCYHAGPWCGPASHAAVTVGATGLIQWATPLDAKEARWIPVGFYAAKEVYDWRRTDGSLPWWDHASDLAGAALGAWISTELFGG